MAGRVVADEAEQGQESALVEDFVPEAMEAIEEFCTGWNSPPFHSAALTYTHPFLPLSLLLPLPSQSEPPPSPHLYHPIWLIAKS